MRALPLVLLLAGCEFTIPSGRYVCDTTADCPPGQSCSEGLCIAGEDMDASVRDAGPRDSGPLPDVPEIDAPETDAGPLVCDPIDQTGCDVGEKCAPVGEEGAGELRCVPAGTVGVLGTCTRSTFDGVEIDDCAPGLVCAGTTCRPMCRHEEGCAEASFICGNYAGIFGELMLGICDEGCDVVSQNRLFDGAAYCASPDLTMPSRGCYGIDQFQCTIAPPESLPLRHGSVPLGPGGGGAYLNGCAPGYMPLMRHPDTGQPVCVAMCRPAATSPLNTTNAGGVAPYRCSDRGAPASSECRFVHFVQDSELPTYRMASNVGFCLEYSRYQWDTNGDAVPDAPFPSCTTINSGSDMNSDGLPDDLQFGCVP